MTKRRRHGVVSCINIRASREYPQSPSTDFLQITRVASARFHSTGFSNGGFPESCLQMLSKALRLSQKSIHKKATPTATTLNCSLKMRCPKWQQMWRKLNR